MIMPSTKQRNSELHFIVDTGSGKFDANERKLIRSHVMKGKNKGRLMPLGSKRNSKPILGSDTQSPQSLGPESPRVGDHDRDARSPYHSAYPRQDPLYGSPPWVVGDVARISATVPRPLVTVSSSTLQLADSVGPNTLHVVLDCRGLATAKRLLYPIESCLAFKRRPEHWTTPLKVDPAFLHAKISTSLWYYETIFPRKPFPNMPGTGTWFHYFKALSLLRQRLLVDNDDLRLSDYTLNVVLSLTGQALASGDVKSASNHMEGMARMADLRGGWPTFQGNEKLAIELIRCDLGIAVYTGVQPTMFRSTAPPPFPDLTTYFSDASLMPNPAESLNITHRTDLGQELTSVMITLSDTCALVNNARASGQKLPLEIFLQSMASIMYNLIDMGSEVEHGHEVVRLGLLSFSCSAFLYWHNMGITYPHLAASVKNAMRRLSPDSSIFSPQLSLWLAMSAACSVLDGSDAHWLHPLIRQAAEESDIQSWCTLRELLMSSMWIGPLHDEAGQRIFEAAMQNDLA
ncbi:hypothetical protein F5Y18DRAFT_366926 [Xylariaceae sp. FL1019]|nr:hypothetical protein F5Y18DRAFT_366926 [Xylariaceae sp. FL1019]